MSNQKKQIDFDSFDVVYHNKNEIPENLKFISFFKYGRWFNRLLEPCAVYISKSQKRALYDISEIERIARDYSLRMKKPVLADDEMFVTRTDLKRAKYSQNEIDAMKPAAELLNRNSFDFFVVYIVKKSEYESRLDAIASKKK